MADTTATNYVTISVDMPDWGTKNAVFTLLEELAIADNGEVVLQKVYTLTLDAAGVGTINLPVYDTAGTGAWGYKLDAPDRTMHLFVLSGDPASQSLGTILASAATSQTPDAIIGILANKQDKVPAATLDNFAAWDALGQTKDSGFSSADFSGIGFDTLSNVLVVDPSFTAATPGWGVYAFATLTTAVAGAVSGDTVYVNGVTTEPGAIVIPAGVHCYVMQNSRVTTDGGTTLAAVTLADATASFLAAGQNLQGVLASGTSSHAEGGGTTSSGTSSHAEGNDTEASGTSSHAEGDSTVASGYTSHAEGDSTTSSGSASHSEGDGTTASGIASHAEGSSTTASGAASHGGGVDSNIAGDTSFGHGNRAINPLGHDGALVLTDNANEDATTIIANEALLQYTGGIRLVTATNGAGTPTATLTIDGQDGTAAIRDADGVAGNAANIDANGDAVDSGIILGTAAAAAVGDFDAAGSASAAQAFSIQRANHTGSQTSSTISDFAATVRETVLTGLSTATATVITAADTVLSGLGKLQAQISGHVAATGTAVHGLGTMSTQTATNYVPISGGTYTGVVNFAAVAVSPIVVHNAGTAGTRFQLSGGTNTASVGFVIGEGSQAAPVTRAFVGWQRVLNVVSLTNGISTNVGVHVDLATGFVGVATNTPTATLHVNGNMKVITMKSGATQAAAGAAAGELWYTVGHATDSDYTVKYGV